MNNITFTTLENKCSLNSFNFLALNIIKPMIPHNDVDNIQYTIVFFSYI